MPEQVRGQKHRAELSANLNELYSLIVCNSMCQWSPGLSTFEIFMSGLPDHSCLLHLDL